jgi:hypothetical protein
MINYGIGRPDISQHIWLVIQAINNCPDLVFVFPECHQMQHLCWKCVAKYDSERMMSAARMMTGAVEVACKMTKAIELKAQAQLNLGRLQTLDEGGQTLNEGGQTLDEVGQTLDKGGWMLDKGGSTDNCDDQVKDYGNHVKDCGNQVNNLEKIKMDKKCGLMRETIQSKALQSKEEVCRN